MTCEVGGVSPPGAKWQDR